MQPGKIFALFVCTLVAAAIAPSRSEAGVLGSATLTLDGWGPHAPSGSPSVNLHIGSTNVTAPIADGGSFFWRNVSSTIPLEDAPAFAPANADLMTFCIELTEDLTFGSTYTVEIRDLADAPRNGPPLGMGSLAASLIKKLWAEYFDDVVTAADKNTAAGAFQLAIWELEYDAGADALNPFTTGALTVSGSLSHSVVTMATAWVQYIINNQNSLEEAHLVALSRPGDFQDQVTELHNPEPASVVLWSVIGSIAAFRSWRRRRGGLNGA